MTEGLHVGVIGVGRIGAFHVESLRALDGVSALTLADADATRALQVARDLDANAAETPEALVDAGVDALVIATATAGHAPLLRLAAAAGLPAFCEKPVALDLAAIDDVLEEVSRAGILVQIGFQRRFDAGYQEARRRVAAGEPGRLLVVRMATHDPAPPHESYIPVSGGIFRDLHIHDFDILRWVTGQEVAEVYADGAVLDDHVFARYGDVDTAVAVLRLEDGTLAILSGTRRDPLGYDVRMELFGVRDSIAVGLDDRTPLRSVEPDAAAPPGPGYRDFMQRFEPAYRAELAAFVDVAQGRAASPCTGEDARACLLVAIAADRSRAEHRPVRVEEVA